MASMKNTKENYNNRKCAICNTNPSESKITFCYAYDNYLCARHKLQFLRQGNFKRSKRDSNNYVFYDDHCEIELFDKNGNTTGFAIIDLDDVEKCKPYKWYMRKDGNNKYVATHIQGQKGSLLFLHRLILDHKGKMPIDHINRNALDNRKVNLRIVSFTTNNLNKSTDGTKRYKGKEKEKYYARFRADGKDYYLGTFDTKEEASLATKQGKLEYIINKESFVQKYSKTA